MSSIVRDLIGDKCQREIAEKTFLTETSISRWIHEKNEPKFIDVQAIAKACGYVIKIEKVEEGDIDERTDDNI